MILLASLSLSLRWSQPVKYLARSPPGKKIEENKNNLEIALREMLFYPVWLNLTELFVTNCWQSVTLLYCNKSDYGSLNECL